MYGFHFIVANIGRARATFWVEDTVINKRDRNLHPYRVYILLKGDRKKLTDTWKNGGVTEEVEFAILTNDIYKEWSGMTAKEYRLENCVSQ